MLQFHFITLPLLSGFDPHRRWPGLQVKRQSHFWRLRRGCLPIFYSFRKPSLGSLHNHIYVFLISAYEQKECVPKGPLEEAQDSDSSQPPPLSHRGIEVNDSQRCMLRLYNLQKPPRNLGLKGSGYFKQGILLRRANKTPLDALTFIFQSFVVVLNILKCFKMPFSTSFSTHICKCSKCDYVFLMFKSSWGMVLPFFFF